MPDIAPRDTSKEWLKAILIWAFMASWIFFFSYSLYGSGCHKFKGPADERLRKCENSLRFTGFLFTDYQRSENLRMQGIALAELERIEDFRRAFDESIQILMPSYSIAQDAALHILREPIREMSNPDLPPKAQELWKRVLLSYLER